MSKLTTAADAPVPDNQDTQSAGPRGSTDSWRTTMTFDEITRQFEYSPNGSGTDAFLAVEDATRDLMSSDPQNAVIYFLIYNFARSYVILHDDEPISSESANESKQQLLDYMKRLDVALTRDEPGLLAAASAVVNDYMRSRRPF